MQTWEQKRGQWQSSRADGRLTAREEAVLAFVRDFWASNGYSPSTREMARAGIVSSTSVAASALDGLEAHGYLTRQPNVSRSIVLTEKGRAT